MSARNDVFFQLWSGHLAPDQEARLRAELKASPALEREFDDACVVFEALKSASQVDAKLDSAFGAQVMSQVHAVGFKKKERLFMKTRKPLVLLGSLTLVAGVLWLEPGMKESGLSKLLTFMEGSIGALLLMVLLFAGLFSILRRNSRFASGFCTAAIALFLIRSQTGTFFNDQVIQGPASSGAEIRYNDARIVYNDTRLSEPVSAILNYLIPDVEPAPDVSKASKMEERPRTAVNPNNSQSAATVPMPSGKTQESGSLQGVFEIEGLALGAAQQGNSPAMAPLREDSDKYADLLAESGSNSNSGDEVDLASSALKQTDAESRVRTQEVFKKLQDRIAATQAPAQAPGIGSEQKDFSRLVQERSIPSSAPGLSPPQAIPPAAVNSAERYGSYEEHLRSAVQTQAFSTFAADVDTASYSNLRRFVSAGTLPPAEAVRIEELVNYFSYDYKTPTETPLGVDYEIAPSPFDKNRHLVRFGVTTRKAGDEVSQPWNLVFLVDVSGSMSDENKLPLVRRSLRVLTENMRAEDQVSIVTYAGQSGVALEPTSGREKAKIIDVIERLGAGGSTNGSGGIEMAYQLAQRSLVKNGVNRVVLATDGDFNVGTTSFADLINLIEAKRRTGVTLTTLGFGTGNLNEQMMEQLANKGNGNFFYIDTFQEAEKVLKKDLVANMQVEAKDVKLQVEFNPRQVKEYRLIGFDNRKLNKEDFTNDAKDAGELGLGHQVTAIYEVLLASSSLEPESLQGSRYQKPQEIKVTEAYSGELGFLRIRYKEPQAEVSKELSFPLAMPKGAEFSEASKDFQFASAVALFGQTLRESRYATGYSLQEVRRLAESARGEDSSGLRSEFLRLVDSVIALRGGTSR